MFLRKRQKINEHEVQNAYDTIIGAARQPVLYTEYNVPDTPAGRFQMITLHAAPIFMDYIRQNKTDESQYLFDLIFRDIELSFREIGVGDLSVPKKMKAYMKDFNGILHAYGAVNADYAAITLRNVFGEGEGRALSPEFEKYITNLFKDANA